MNNTKVRLRGILLSLCGALSAVVVAEPVTYEIDSDHTFPSFEADHMRGFSIWRGKIRETSGTIVLDREAQTGTIEVIMDMASIDFGQEDLNEHAKAPDIFDVAQFPTATYAGALVEFEDGAPTAVEGSLTMHGVTRPLNLSITRFMCVDSHRFTQRRACGADATASLDRSDWGVDFGRNGHEMWVNLNIQVEAQAAD